MISIRKAFLLISGLTGFFVLYGQQASFKDIFERSQQEYGLHPLLQNGLYYEYPYYYSKGHPFLLDGQFHKGSIVFRDKRYEDIEIRYDIFHQQVILNLLQGQEMVQILAAMEFVSAFRFEGRDFMKLTGADGQERYFQIVAAGDELICAYSWYKNRNESSENQSFKTYIFGEPKTRKYLFYKGTEYRYRNNKTFAAIFPPEARQEIRSYLKAGGIKVNKADDRTMNDLIGRCRDLLNPLNQNSKR
ncbi:MAG: hypothetical protein ACOYXB_11120 [Bacteroidota bacterium]